MRISRSPIRTPQGSVALASTPGTTVEFTSGDPTGVARVRERDKSRRVRDQAAATMRVSAGYVNDAKDLSKADPERFAQVRSGALTIPAAQEEIVAEAHAAGTPGHREAAARCGEGGPGQVRGPQHAETTREASTHPPA